MKATYENSAASKVVSKPERGLGSNLVLLMAVALVIAGGSTVAATLFRSDEPTCEWHPAA